MASLKKQIYGLAGSGVVIVSGLLLFAAKIPPQTESAVPVFVMLVFQR